MKITTLVHYCLYKTVNIQSGSHQQGVNFDMFMSVVTKYTLIITIIAHKSWCLAYCLSTALLTIETRQKLMYQ